MRISKILLAIFMMLVSATAGSMGIGEIKLNSALNEPLNAQIELFSVRDADFDNIIVRMGSLKDFANAGIDKAAILNKVKFKVVHAAGGKVAIQVTSRQPIREPFLNFLVEVTWPEGRVLREYTVLLDPPVFARKAAASVQAPVATAPAQPEVSTVKEPAPSKPVPVTVSEDEKFPLMDIEIPGKGETPAIAVDSYKVKRSETLWSIANKLKPADSSAEQMMMALLSANPQAFVNNNINNLKSGSVLKVPDEAAIKAMNNVQAIRAVAKQNAEWRATSPSKAVPTGSPEVMRKPKAAPAAAAEQEPAEVKLVSPTGKGSMEGDLAGRGKADLEKAEKKLALAKESLAAQQSENADLKGQITDLQKQIDTMKRLLALKDDSLAEMQGKLAGKQPVAPEAPAPAPEAKPEPAAAPPAPVEEKAKEPSQVALNNPYAVKDFPKSKVDKPEATVVAPKPAPKPKALPKPAPAEDSGFGIGSLLDNPAILGALIVVILALGFLVWQFQRRRMRSMQFPESILTERSGLEPKASEETSLLSDFAPSSMDSSLDTQVDEVDALSEADVYLAYNKYDQAEELLLEAIHSQPERVELKVKLLEVYFASHNAASFLNAAQTLHDELGDTNAAVWDKVVEMGSSLCPDSTLFGAAEAEPEAVAEEPVIEEEEFKGFEISEEAPEEEPESLDMGEPSLDFTTEAAEEKLNADLAELESELDALTGEAETEELEVPETTVDDMSLDFDLGEPAEEAPVEEAPAEAEEDMLSLDEVATKLDLAKAYIDMGDPDGARSILDEVMNEGNQAQRDEAQELLGQL